MAREGWQSVTPDKFETAVLALTKVSLDELKSMYPAEGVNESAPRQLWEMNPPMSFLGLVIVHSPSEVEWRQKMLHLFAHAQYNQASFHKAFPAFVTKFGEDVRSWPVDDYKDYNLLGITAWNNLEAQYNWLLEQGITIPGDSMPTALHALASGGRASVLTWLIPKMASVDVCWNHNGWQWTPLGLAAAEGNVEIVRGLLENGADVNALQNVSLGLTALHVAATAGHQDVFECLVSSGADVSAITTSGETVFDRVLVGDAGNLVETVCRSSEMFPYHDEVAIAKLVEAITYAVKNNKSNVVQPLHTLLLELGKVTEDMKRKWTAASQRGGNNVAVAELTRLMGGGTLNPLLAGGETTRAPIRGRRFSTMEGVLGVQRRQSAQRLLMSAASSATAASAGEFTSAAVPVDPSVAPRPEITAKTGCCVVS